MRNSICLVTCREAAGLTPSDQLFFQALTTDGWSVAIEAWDATHVDWSSYRAVILRSTWDYHLRPEEFRQWLVNCREANVTLYNPPDLALWNMHKGYLLELADRGIPVVPTELLRQGESSDLAALLEARDWDQIVLKPAIAATAHHTFRASRGDVAEAAVELRDALGQSDYLVQPFVPEIVAAGELSFQFFAGDFNHAILKQAKPGDFRVQADFGGTTQMHEPSSRQLAQVKRVVDAIPRPWLYARVDGVDIGGEFVVMEVELIEPELFLGEQRGAAEKMAIALKRLLTARA